MRHKAFFAMAVVLGLGISVVAAQAQQGKTLTTIGPVAKISGDSFTVDTGQRTPAVHGEHQHAGQGGGWWF